MSLLYNESWDDFATADIVPRWNSLIQDGARWSIGAFGRNSTNALRMAPGGANSAGPFLYRSVAPGDANVRIGTAYTPNSFPVGSGASIVVMSVLDGNAEQLTVQFTQLGKLAILRGAINTGTVLATSTNSLVAGNTVFIELKATIHPSAGTIELFVDNTSVNWIPSTTGLNTRSTGTTQWNGIAFGKQGTGVASANGTTFDYDDTYLLDGVDATATQGAPFNDVLGDVTVRSHFANGVGNSAGWTRGGVDSGQNWSQMDEAAANGDTDYVTATATATKDLYTYEDLKAPGKTILAVTAVHEVRKSEPGTAAIGTVFRQGSTDYPPASGIVAGVTYTFPFQIFGVNPATGLPWTESDFNAIQAGPYKTA